MRESSANAKLWKKTRKDNAQLRASTQALERMQRQIAAMRGRKLAPDPWFPFKIYNYPSGLRKYQNNDDWRRVKVRMGWIQADDGTLIPVDGCDYNGLPLTEISSEGFNASATTDTYFNYPVFGDAWQGQLPPDDSSDIYINSSISRWNEILIPDDGTVISIWVCASYDINGSDDLTVTSTPFVAFGEITDSTPFPDVAATSLATGVDFTDVFPNSEYSSDDPYHYMIGKAWVENGSLNISQLQYDVIQAPLSAPIYTSTTARSAQTQRFCGEYDSSTYYYNGDSVCVTDSEWRATYILRPTTDAYSYMSGPVLNIDPSTNTPNPWFLLSRSPIVGTFTTGAYDAAKYYLRHS